MKRFCTLIAVVLLAIFAAAACNDYGNTFQSPGGALITFLSPKQIPACPAPCTNNPSFTLTINGTGFVAKTLVQWNGKTCPLSSSSGATNASCTTNVTLDSNSNVTLLTATISSALIAQPGTAVVNTMNPGSNYGTGTNGLSNTITFIVNNPPNLTPTVSSVTPACAVVGSPLAITVTGTNFMNVPASSDPSQTQVSRLNWTLGSSQLQLTPYTVTPTTITATQITATIPATSINAAGTATVTVYNPPSLPLPTVPGSTGSGGGTSTPPASVTVQTTACPVAAKAPANSVSTGAVAEETPAVSLDGRYVAYTALGDPHAQVFLRDTCEGAPTSCQSRTSLLSVTSGGDPGAGDSHTPSMSSDGRYIAFSSDATDLVENAPPGRQ
ncbi:MAG: IPT/TIG domain-containing protein, partial [Acidobacteria bacterium Pan2503]|nr:IPT/TIG domain-containing protein [Candidatus Acidoferrum panamensis]